MALQKLVAIPKLKFLDFILFIYFLTLHADQLSFTLGGLTFRLNNIIALLLLPYFLGSLYTVDKKVLFTFFFLSISLLISSCRETRSLIFFGWYLVTILLYFFLPVRMMRISAKEHIFKLYLLSFFFVGLYGFFQLFFSFFGFHDLFAPQWILERFVRPNAFAYEPSYYALYFTPFVMIINLMYLNNTMSLKGLITVNLLYVISTSTSCFFAYCAFFLLLFCFKDFRKKALRCCLFFFGLLVSLLILFPSLSKDYFLKFFFHGFMTHHSFNERWVQICNSWKIFLEHPFFGIGLGGIPHFLYQSWQECSDQFFFLSGASKIDQATRVLKYFEPSNVFTELLASTGLIGTTLTCILLFLLFKPMRKSLNEPWIFYFFVSSLVMLVVLQFNQGLFRTYIWVHLALGYGLATNKENCI